jgi:hypothetical protein
MKMVRACVGCEESTIKQHLWIGLPSKLSICYGVKAQVWDNSGSAEALLTCNGD